MANILILGAGSMGTAFSFPCSDNNHSVSIIGTHLENDFINQINSKKNHPALNCNIPEGAKFLKFEKLRDEINKKVDLIVVAVISKGIEWASIELSKVLKTNIPILILTKGLAINNNNYEVLAHKMERLLKKNGIKETNISAAGGPCLAKGLANKVHTSVVFANTDINIAKQISRLVSTDYYHVFISDDIVGVEICAAIKNIFSMAIGASQSLCHPSASKEIKEKYYLNTAAALIQESIYEMIIFTEKLKGKKETAMGLAGIGDLYVSADGGRNSKMGEYLGKGMTFRTAKKKKMPYDTVEGADLALEIGSKVKSDFDHSTFPLMLSMIDTICNETPLKLNWKNFRKSIEY
jgi:glycerol-3-phosphate dehydrogenase (NAD(P)+)